MLLKKMLCEKVAWMDQIPAKFKKQVAFSRNKARFTSACSVQNYREINASVKLFEKNHLRSATQMQWMQIKNQVL